MSKIFVSENPKGDPSSNTLLVMDSQVLESDPFVNLKDGIFMIGKDVSAPPPFLQANDNSYIRKWESLAVVSRLPAVHQG